MNISDSIRNRMNVKSFIQSIRIDNDKLVKAHVLSGKFSEYDLHQALMLAAYKGKSSSLKYLTSLNYEQQAKNNALNLSSNAGLLQSIHILETTGADVHNEDDFSFYQASSKIREAASLYLMLQTPKFENIEYSLKRMYQKGHRQYVMDCLALQTMITDKNKVLDWAVDKNKPEFAKGALFSGADANLNNGELLLKSIYNGNNQLITLLTDYGADILARTEHVLLDAIKKVNNLETTKLVYGILKKVKKEGVVLKPNEGKTIGLKIIN